MTIQFRVTQRIVGFLLSIFSFSMVPPALIGLYYGDGAVMPFVDAFVVTLIMGLLLYIPARQEQRALRMRDGFIIVVAFWAVLGTVGALPFLMYEELELTIPQAIFESMSGLTTTGATLIVGLDQLPHSILFYRQEMQWLGGMGIIVLAIAVLPMLGIGGMQLYRAETPGISKEKLTPRVAGTAKALWYIYVGLTLLCAIAYRLAGMDWFDAISHSFTTVSIGGFSTHDASIGYFSNPTIEMIAVVFMFISGINFSLHFLVFRNVRFRKLPTWRSLSWRQYAQDEEFRFYVMVLVVTSLVTTLWLLLTHTESINEAAIDAVFHVVSIGTTTGYTSTEYFLWPHFLPVLLLYVSFIGGCAGSTGGGMKVVRVLLLLKQGSRELKRLVHPNATLLVKMGNRPVPNQQIDLVWGFFAAYVGLMAIMLLILMADGNNQETAFSAVVACLNNLGPGLGDVAANYSGLDSVSLLVLSMAMLFGRLEIFTLLVLFTPAFWKK